AISVARGSRPRIAGVDVHNVNDLPVQAIDRRQVPCANPLRTLVDFAAIARDWQLDDATDKALASRLLTVDAIESELSRLGRRGRTGVGRMRAALLRRGFVGAPHPSVLESRYLRLLYQAGITPLEAEVVVGEGGRYRIDTLLTPTLASEVDGYAHHSSPE